MPTTPASAALMPLGAFLGYQGGNPFGSARGAFLGLDFGPNLTITDANNGFLRVDGAAAVAPGAPDRSVQFNNAGVFAGSANLLFEAATSRITSLNGYAFANGAFRGVLAMTPTAARTITLPDVTGTVAILDATQVLTNKTIDTASNTLTSTGAALGDMLKHDGTKYVLFPKTTPFKTLTVNSAGTDVAWGDPDFGALSLTCGNIKVGPQFTSPAAAGSIRGEIDNIMLAVRNSGNTADLVLVATNAINELYLGSNKTFGVTSQVVSTNLDATTQIYTRIGGNAISYTDANALQMVKPILGIASPYGVHGEVDVDAANAPVVLSAAQYIYQCVNITGVAFTANRAVTWPSPATKAGAYTATMRNNSAAAAFGVVISASGGGTTITLANALACTFLVTTTGIVRLTADSLQT